MSESISIIIPTYNRISYLEALINQLLSQSQPPHEIIVVDDHSTDNTATLVRDLALKSLNIKYLLNQGHHQRDAKKTGLKYATGEYLGFLDDDAQIEDPYFFAKLVPRLGPCHVIQAKIILEQMGRENRPDITWKDILATRPYPVLELLTSNFNCGSTRRTIFPLIEWGNFWHRSLQQFFIDDNLTKDGYGESYSSSLKLYRAGIKLLLEPSLVIRHPGAPSGGSHKFHKKTMLADFTEFHYGYFYNMVYLHKRFFPGWVWLWLPFYFTKSLIALAINKNIKGWREYAIKPMLRSLAAGGVSRGSPAARPQPMRGRTVGVQAGDRTRRHDKIFVWQGYWRGGAERITLAAATCFSKHGLAVTLGVYKKDLSIPLEQITFPRPKLIPLSFRSLFSSLIFRARHAKKFQAVYAHTLGAWKTKHNKLFIHDAADLNVKLTKTSGRLPKLSYSLWRFLYLRLCLKSATAIFSATPEFTAYLACQQIPPQNIIASSSFYDDKIFHYQKRSLLPEPLNIIFIGDYNNPTKNFLLVKKLFYKNDNYAVTIAGNDNPHHNANFNYLGWLQPQPLQQALAKAHIFFMPSRSEGFSIALLEALATGIPCLVNQDVIPLPLKNILNIISYKSEDEVMPKINHITRNYPHYNTPDHRLDQFTQSKVLPKELEVIVGACASRPSNKTLV